ncbi:MAG: FAD-dependent oxidoreductase [Chloroflexi bacterium]|nr:FAD-dependent oxidoreductase [Chloroflexota bacterium]
MGYTYDLIVIGAGSGGLTAAGFAAQLGARVALVEKHRIGGDCLWTGCVPSKTLLKVAKVAHQMRTADRYGLSSVEPDIDLGKVMAHVQATMEGIYQDHSPALRENGIDVFDMETGRFVDPHTVAAGDTRLTGRKILITTGAHPFIPAIPGLDGMDYLTYESIWKLNVLPRRLIVVGGGPIGCEMAQSFRRLGAEVTIVEGGDRILPGDEPAASQALTDVFAAEGIDVRRKVVVERVWQDKNGIHVAAGAKLLAADALLIAVGRRPSVDGLDLEKAGVAYSAKGIEVDDHLRTSQGHIYAAGDCASAYQFTHYAGWQAFMAARNALLPGASRGVSDRVPWTTFTDPEVAHVGFTEDDARSKLGNAVMTCEWPMDRVDRARAEGDAAGFLKLVHKKDGTLLGATIVAGRAGEMLHEWVVALERGLKVGDLAGIIHVYPTYSTASMQAAAAIRVEQFLRGISGKVARGLVGLMR